MNSTRSRFRSDVKHTKVAQKLRDLIVSGRFAPGQALPHRDELEGMLGASRMTVQTALNALIGDGFLHTSAGRGTFVADRPPFLTDLGLVFPFPRGQALSSRFFASLLAAGADAARERGGKLHVHYNVTAPHGEDYEGALLDRDMWRVGGLIFAGVTYDLRGSEVLRPGFPVSAVQDGPCEVFSGPSVYPDLHGFFRLAARHCLRAGRRRAAIFSCAMLDALPTYADATRRAGLSVPEELVFHVNPLCVDAVRPLVRLVCALPPSLRPDALIIADDNLVEPVTEALRDLAARSPRGQTVVAMGNIPRLPRPAVPCDVYAFDASEVIAACVRQIDCQLLGRPAEPLVRVAPKLLPQLSLSNS